MTKRQVTTKGSFMEQKKKELKGVYAQLHREQQLLLSQFSFDNFVEYIMLDEKGKYAKQAEIHMSWTRFIEDCWKDRINPAILAPWGHGKSMQQAIGRPLFELGRDLNLRIKIVCNSANNATKRVTTLKNYIEQSNRLHEVFPHVVPGFDHWTNTSLNVAGRLFSDVDHSIESYGIESRAVGGRADLIIFDDVVDDKSEQSPAHRKMVKDNFENVFMSRLEPEGRVIFIGTMWHVDDLNANLIGSPGWRFMIQGVSENFKYIEEVII